MCGSECATVQHTSAQYNARASLVLVRLMWLGHGRSQLGALQLNHGSNGREHPVQLSTSQHNACSTLITATHNSNQRLNNYVRPLYCQAKMYAGCVACWVMVTMLMGQTDRWTDARPLHYAFCYGRDAASLTTLSNCPFFLELLDDESVLQTRICK